MGVKTTKEKIIGLIGETKDGTIFKFIHNVGGLNMCAYIDEQDGAYDIIFLDYCGSLMFKQDYRIISNIGDELARNKYKSFTELVDELAKYIEANKF